jgi:hypothetical protein
MYSFDIAIENKARRVRQAIGVHIMAALLLCCYGLAALSTLPQVQLQLFTALPLGLGIFYLVFFKKQLLMQSQVTKNIRLVEAAFVSMAAVAYFKQQHYLVAIFFALSAILLLVTLVAEQQLYKGYRVVIDDKGITRLVGSANKFIAWHEVDNVVINHNILTVDLKNNYLMQSKFTNYFTEADIEKFNSYCQVYLMINDKK